MRARAHKESIPSEFLYGLPVRRPSKLWSTSHFAHHNGVALKYILVPKGIITEMDKIK